MKEFVEKLIGKLKTNLNKSEKMYQDFLDKGNLACVYDISDIQEERIKTIKEIIKIVNQLAEEYNGYALCKTREFCDYQFLKDDGWIPCSERLPEKGGAYLVCSEKQSVYVAHFYKNSVVPHWSKGNIIYWQPLPEPYQKGE